MGAESVRPPTGKPGQPVKDPKLEQLARLKREHEEFVIHLQRVGDIISEDRQKIADGERQIVELEREIRLSSPEGHSQNTIFFPTDPQKQRILIEKLIQYQGRKTDKVFSKPDEITENDYKIVIIQCLVKYQCFDLEDF